MMRPPAAWTASVTRRHPRTCSELHRPGVSAQPNPSGLIAVASATIRPADARRGLNGSTPRSGTKFVPTREHGNEGAPQHEASASKSGSLYRPSPARRKWRAAADANSRCLTDRPAASLGDRRVGKCRCRQSLARTNREQKETKVTKHRSQTPDRSGGASARRHAIRRLRELTVQLCVAIRTPSSFPSWPSVRISDQPTRMERTRTTSSTQAVLRESIRSRCNSD